MQNLAQLVSPRAKVNTNKNASVDIMSMLIMRTPPLKLSMTYPPTKLPIVIKIKNIKVIKAEPFSVNSGT